MNNLDVHEEIALRIRTGADLDEVDRELIEPATLGEDEKAALWLFAWALLA